MQRTEPLKAHDDSYEATGEGSLAREVGEAETVQPPLWFNSTVVAEVTRRQGDRQPVLGFRSLHRTH